MKAYELALNPEQLHDFLSVWESAADAEDSGAAGSLDALAEHLVKATQVLDRLAEAEPARRDAPEALGPGLEAVLNLDGGFIFKSNEWDSLHPDCATLFEALPLWNLAEVRRAFTDLSHARGLRSKLIVCTDEDDESPSMLLLQKQGTGPGFSQNTVYARWLKSAWSERLSNFFQEEYGLTGAELGVFEQIVSGRSFGEIVERLGKSQETVKSQSKSIYSKLGVSGREAAVRFALHVQFLLPSATPETVKRAEALASEVLNIEGCQYGITRKGALSGQPFMLLHGIVSGYEFGPAFENALRRQNLCAICIERPGYGRSDDPDVAAHILDEWLARFPALMKAVGLEQTCLVTHASGGTYVAATLGAYAQLAPRGLCISTGMPNFDGAGDTRFPVSHRFLYWCLRKSPSTLAFYLKAYGAYLNHDRNYEKLMRRNYARGPSDSAVLDVPENMRCIIAGYKLMERPRMQGLIGDLTSLWQDMDRWKDLASQADGQAHMHHVWGAQDPMIDFDASRAYCAQHPFTSWSRIEDGGHLLQFSHADALASRIKQMVTGAPEWTAP